MNVRQFERDSDLAGVRACLIELQDFERNLDPRMPAGEQIADEYIAEMLARCDRCDGQIFVVSNGEEICGYLTVLARVRTGDVEDGNLEHGLVDDLIVREKYRGRGLGRRMLEAAESYALARKVRWLRTCVLASNERARRLYENAGFSELYVDIEKDLQMAR